MIFTQIWNWNLILETTLYTMNKVKNKFLKNQQIKSGLKIQIITLSNLSQKKPFI